MTLDVVESMAEREGFEPPIALRLCLISSQVHSTGLCHLSALLLFYNSHEERHPREYAQPNHHPA
jgi:hypothetical protein